MSSTVAVTRVACNTGTGNQDITTADLGGLTPVAALFIATHATSDGTAADHALWSVGAATATDEQWVVANHNEHGSATANSGRRAATDECVMIVSTNSGTVNGEAAFVSFIENGVRINWGNPLGSAFLLTVVLFAGAEVSAHADVLTLSTEDTAVDVTDPAFEPDLVLFGTDCMTFGDSDTAGLFWSVGAAVNDGTPTQVCWGNGNNNGAAEGDPSSIMYSNRVVCQTTNVAITWSCEISGFDASGFTATAKGGNSGGDQVGYLALAFSDVDVWAGVIDSPTSTGDDAQTGPGFEPQFVMLGLTLCQATDTQEFDSDAGAIGLAVIDADEAYCNSTADEYGSATTDTQSLSDDAAVNFAGDDGSAMHVASFSSFDANGWTLTYTTTDGTARKWWAVAIEAVEEAAGGVATQMYHYMHH
jgi:hypothetical protein